MTAFETPVQQAQADGTTATDDKTETTTKTTTTDETTKDARSSPPNADSNTVGDPEQTTDRDKDTNHTMTPPTVESESFNDYWAERTTKRNTAEGHPERNDPGHSWPLGRFEPHRLGMCKRKWAYDWLNAPQEDRDPYGIFAIGHYIEEHVIEPWLQDKFEPAYDLDNAVHVSTTVTDVQLPDSLPDQHESETVTRLSLPDDITVTTTDDATPLPAAGTASVTIAGSTDPVVKHTDTEDIALLTEVKSTSNIERFTDSPKQRHVWQVHAYMNALSIDTACIIYVDKQELLDPVVFTVSYSESIWQDITNWTTDILTTVAQHKLPDADPPHDYACRYCEYRNRCGEGRSNLGGDMDTTGFVPGYTGYPREEVTDHLQATDNARLTPSLAIAYPDLADTTPVENWVCPRCSATFNYTNDELAEQADTMFQTPHCPACDEVFNTKTRLQTESRNNSGQ